MGYVEEAEGTAPWAAGNCGCVWLGVLSHIGCSLRVEREWLEG